MDRLSSRTGAGTSELTRVALLCLAISFAILAVHTDTAVSTNPASRLATIDALVHDKTFVIDNSVFKWTVDRVVIADRSYSSKPPLLSTAGAALYWALVHTTDLTLRDDQQRERTIYVLSLLLGGIPHLLVLVFGYACLRWFAPDPTSGALAMVCLALGQLGLAYSTTINNHVPAAAAVLAAFYYSFALRRGFLRGNRFFCYAGLAAGLAIPLDLGTIFFSAALGLYLLTWKPKATLQLFAPAALAPLLAHFALTWWITKSPVPVYLRPELYQYPGSYWLNPVSNDSLNEPRLVYLYNILLGHHGLFSMTPVIAFSVLAIAQICWRREREWLLEAAVVGAPLLMMIVFYTFTTRNYGGNSVGFRWFLPAVPLTLLFVARSAPMLRRRAGLAAFTACLTVSLYHVYAALAGPWAQSSWEQWLAGS